MSFMVCVFFASEWSQGEKNHLIFRMESHSEPLPFCAITRNTIAFSRRAFFGWYMQKKSMGGTTKKIVNPKTGRLVSVNGRVGKKLVKKAVPLQRPSSASDSSGSSSDEDASSSDGSSSIFAKLNSSSPNPCFSEKLSSSLFLVLLDGGVFCLGRSVGVPCGRDRRRSERVVSHSSLGN